MEQKQQTPDLEQVLLSKGRPPRDPKPHNDNAGDLVEAQRKNDFLIDQLLGHVEGLPDLMESGVVNASDPDNQRYIQRLQNPNLTPAFNDMVGNYEELLKGMPTLKYIIGQHPFRHINSIGGAGVPPVRNEDDK